MNKQDLSDLIQQGQQRFEWGNFQGAIARWSEAAVLAYAQNEHNNELQALTLLPPAWGNLADYQKMAEAATHLLARARQLQIDFYEMEAILWLATALAHLDLRGHWQELKPLLLEGLTVAQRLNKHQYEIYHLIRLGEYAVKVGEEEQGFLWLQEALNAIRPDMEKNQYFFHGDLYGTLSLLMRKRGEYSEATRYAKMAIRASLDYSNPIYVASAQLTFAHAERAQGKGTQALWLTEQVLRQAQHLEWKGIEQEAEYLRGELTRELGHADIAEGAARQALELAQEMMEKEEEVKCLLSLGQALLELRRINEAHDVLEQVQRLSQKRGYEDHFNSALALLEGVE